MEKFEIENNNEKKHKLKLRNEGDCISLVVDNISIIRIFETGFYYYENDIKKLGLQIQKQ